jgi:hypothetical protein
MLSHPESFGEAGVERRANVEVRRWRGAMTKGPDAGGTRPGPALPLGLELGVTQRGAPWELLVCAAVGSDLSPVVNSTGLGGELHLASVAAAIVHVEFCVACHHRIAQ